MVDSPRAGSAEPVGIAPIASERSARDRVKQVLREAVIAGEMLPGRLYSAPELAAMLGVSATPVREAMIELTAEGMVDTIRYRGYQVREVPDAELDEIVAVRMLLEVPAAEQVARAGIPELVRPLRPVAAAIVDYARAGKFREFIAADTEFHLGLLELTGNRTLTAEVKQLREKSRLRGLEQLNDRGLLVPTAMEHVTLLELTEAGDADAVGQLMRQHLGHVRDIWSGRHP